MVGELVITQSMLSQYGEFFSGDQAQNFHECLARLEQNSRELQECVMTLRMLPVSTVFNRFPRMVRETSAKLNKKIKLVISGESTEMDKTMLEKIVDPLVHLVRNSLDHGIEMPETREKKGKSSTGTIHLMAYHEGSRVCH